MATLNAIYRIAADISGLQASMDKGVAATERVEGGLKKLGDSLSGAGLSLTKLFGAFSAANLAADLVSTLTSEVKELAERGLRLPAVEASFNTLTKSVGQDSAEMLQSLQTATKGMVSEFDLMLGANKALLLGLPVTKESMADMAGAATALGRAMGIDATKSLDDLITALGRSSPMILDNLGLSVKLGEANEAMAQKLGKSADSLTDAEKKMAFYEAAMEAARKKTAELGDQTKTLGEIASAAWTSIGNEITRASGLINVGVGSAVSSMKNFAAFATNVIKSGIGAAISIEAVVAQAEAAEGAVGRFSLKNTEATKVIAPVVDQLTKYRKSLDTIKTSAEKLTPTQRDLIASAVKLGQSAEDIAKGTGLSVNAIEVQIDSMKTAKKAADEHGRALKKIADDDIKRLIDSYNDFADNLKKIRTVSSGIPSGLSEIGRFPIDAIKSSWDQWGASLKTVRTVTVGIANELKDLGATDAGIAKLSKQSRDWLETLKDARKEIDGIFRGAMQQGTNLVGRLLGSPQEFTAIVGSIQQAATATKLLNTEGLTTGQRFKANAAVIEAQMRTFFALQGMAKQLMERERNAGEDAATFMRAAGTLRDFQLQARMAAVDLEQLFHIKDQEAFTALFEKAKLQIQKTNEQMQRFGLTWHDFTAETQDFVRNTAADLIDAFKDFTAKGVNAQKLLRGMSGDLSQLVIDSVRTGSRMPAAMLPILEQAIRMRVLTEDAARALLGLEATGTPALADIEAAAARYGKTLDDLGPKVKQLQINEIANQIVKDYEMFVEATGDVGRAHDIVQGKVQEVVISALRLGLTLPDSLRPIIQSMIDAGLLTDEFGDKLTDTSRLNFAKPLTDKIDELIKAIKDLIDETDRYGQNAVTNFDRARNAAIALGKAVPRGFASNPPSGDTAASAQGAATGGMVGMSNILPFRGSGMDRVLAALSPGEMILNRPQQLAVGRAIGGGVSIGNLTVNSNASDPRAVAREVTREIMLEQRRNQRLNTAA